MNSAESTSNRSIYFISDAHAGSHDTEAEQRKDKNLSSFFSYLATVSPPPVLYIVGDLFDYWFEYRHAVPSTYQKILGQLTFLVDHGVDIRYVTGNHDYWMGRFFPEYLKIPVFHSVHTLRVGTKKFQIFHGDGILKEDVGYRVLKNILRNKVVIAIYKLIHPDLGIPLARLASSTSRKHSQRTSEQAKSEDEQYLAYAMDQFESGFDYVILAHTHRPQSFSSGQNQYMNLGDWIDHFTFAIYDGIDLRLYRWNDGLVEIQHEVIDETLLVKSKKVPETL